MKDLSGQTFGQYTIEAPIGQGGMATVYKAYQSRVRRYVAIKVLPEALAADPNFIIRFEREAFTIAQLEHPAILPVYDYGETDNITYIVMRYVDTGSLADRMELAPLSYAEISRLLRQVAEGLSYAHRQGVIHRDLKPDNIFLDSEGNALLGDFGIAHIAEGTLELTGNAVIGTPAYMSPEQGRGKPIDGRSDIYALGIILFELFTGQVPYKAETPMGIVVKHLTEPMPDPRTIKPDIPAEVAAVIMKATAKEPKERYNAPLALATALEEALEGAVSEPSRGTAVSASDKTVLETATESWETVADSSVPPKPSLSASDDVKKAGSSGRNFSVGLIALAAVVICILCAGAVGLMVILQNGDDNNNNNSTALGTPTQSGNNNENSRPTRDPAVIPTFPTTGPGEATPVIVPTIQIPTPVPPDPNGPPTQASPPEFVGMQVVESEFLTTGGRIQYEFANIFEGSISGAVQPEGNLDLVVEILDGNGDLLLTVDQFGGGGNELFSFTPTTPAGNYFIVVSEFSGEAGNFTIVMAGTPAIFFVIDNGSSVAGRVEAENSASFFIEGFAGQSLTVEVQPDSDLDAVVRLFQDSDIVTAVDTGILPDPLAQGDLFEAGGAETLTYTFAQSGLFIIDVIGFSGDNGTFTMRIIP